MQTGWDFRVATWGSGYMAIAIFSAGAGSQYSSCIPLARWHHPIPLARWHHPIPGWQPSGLKLPAHWLMRAHAHDKCGCESCTLPHAGIHVCMRALGCRDQMRMSMEDHPLMLAEPSHNTKAAREKMVELAMEQQHVPGVGLAGEPTVARGHSGVPCRC
jgi:hypothetical protein